MQRRNRRRFGGIFFHAALAARSTMADIFCNNCGLIFDSRIVPCPRCRSCSRCGTVCPAGAENCPQFEHPRDGEEVEAMERRLDPSVLSNQKIIRWCEEGWANSQLLNRLNIWGNLVMALLTTACTIALNEAMIAAGVGLWVRVVVTTLAFFTLMRVFLILLRLNWFRVFLRSDPSQTCEPNEAEDPAEQSLAHDAADPSGSEESKFT